MSPGRRKWRAGTGGGRAGGGCVSRRSRGFFSRLHRHLSREPSCCAVSRAWPCRFLEAVEGQARLHLHAPTPEPLPDAVSAVWFSTSFERKQAPSQPASHTTLPCNTCTLHQRPPHPRPRTLTPSLPPHAEGIRTHASRQHRRQPIHYTTPQQQHRRPRPRRAPLSPPRPPRPPCCTRSTPCIAVAIAPHSLP